MRTVTLVALSLVLLAVVPPTALAQCDCIGATFEIRGSKYATAYEELVGSDSVFIGEVVNVKRVRKPPNAKKFKGSQPDELEVRFKVKSAWKRNLEEFVVVRNSIDGCLIGFEKGEQYLVYAVADGNMLRTWYCSRTRLADRAQKDIKEFEAKGVRLAEIIQ